jgi:hypothetical protein
MGHRLWAFCWSTGSGRGTDGQLRYGAPSYQRGQASVNHGGHNEAVSKYEIGQIPQWMEPGPTPRLRLQPCSQRWGRGASVRRWRLPAEGVVYESGAAHRFIANLSPGVGGLASRGTDLPAKGLAGVFETMGLSWSGFTEGKLGLCRRRLGHRGCVEGWSRYKRHLCQWRRRW